MKKLLLTNLMAFAVIYTVAGQSFDWNIRGGFNLMNSKSTGTDLAVLYHGGLQAGVRITNIGLYGEVTYSVHADQYGGDPIAYLIPAVVAKAYTFRFVFVEFGGAYLSKQGDSGVDPDIKNPDEKLFVLAGLGVHVSKIEVSLRAVSKQSYGVIQLTAALKF